MRLLLFLVSNMAILSKLALVVLALKLSTHYGFEPLSVLADVRVDAGTRGEVCLEIEESPGSNSLDPVVVQRSCWQAEEQPPHMQRWYRGLSAGIYHVQVRVNGSRVVSPVNLRVLCNETSLEQFMDRQQYPEDNPCPLNATDEQ